MFDIVHLIVSMSNPNLLNFLIVCWYTFIAIILFCLAKFNKKYDTSEESNSSFHKKN